MPKKPRRKQRASKPKKFEPVPKEFHTVTPYLAVNGAAEAIEWYEKAFRAKELEREQGPDGKLIHGRIQIGDSIVMLSDIFPGAIHKDPRELGASSVTLHIYSKDVDALWKKAVEAGAKVEMQLDDMFWGERYGQLTDPFGHAWSLSMRIQMSPEEMERRRQEAMKMFEQGQHPGHDQSTQTM
ncbi:MAG: VOC family protein [Candidatus Bathyarchaeia archaeon]